jgi:hypothetical protein
LHLYMCIHYLHRIHPPIPFPTTPSHSAHLPSLLCRTSSTLLFSDFVEEKTFKMKRETWNFC